MTNREIDCLVMGAAVGGTTCLWIGYKLRQRVERWRTGRRARREARDREHDFPTTVAIGRRAAKTIPFPLPGAGTAASEQLARRVLADRPRVIPLEKRDPRARRWQKDVPHWSDPRSEVAQTAQAIRKDAVDALMDAGFKKVEAVDAVDTCSLVERAGGLESWIAAALRHATAVKKP